MERFWFDADAQWAPIGTLSGGEQRRLQLLLVLAAMPNVLLLDEPSNDLDLDTLRAFEDYLETWPGTVVVASHDRAFLERTVEDVLVLDGKGRAALAPGGYAGYAASHPAIGPKRGPASASGTFAGHRPASSATATAPSRRPASAATAPAAALPAPSATATAPAAGSTGSSVIAPAAAGPAASGTATGPAKLRSASTLRRLLGLAEREVSQAEQERDRLAAALAAGTADHTALEELAHSLAGAEARLAQAEERWLALAEELGG
jgi:ATP-binding cassette subfamily F protein uup